MISSEIRLAAVVVPGTYAGSLAVFADCRDIAMQRGSHLIKDQYDAVLPLTVLSMDGRDVSVSAGMKFKVDRAIDVADRFDFIWLPSFRTGGEGMMRQRLAGVGMLLEWLRRQADHGCVFGASGASALLLTAAGLLNGLAIPTAASLLPVSRSLFPGQRFITDMPWVEQGDYFLSSGPFNDLEALSNAFGKLLSPYTSNWLRATLGSTSAMSSDERLDPLVSAAKVYLEHHFVEVDVSIAELARHLGVTYPTLIRRFKQGTGDTPSRYLTRVRLQTAKRLLLSSRHTVERISALVGYGDARLFRAMFQREMNMSASEWRKAGQLSFPIDPP